MPLLLLKLSQEFLTELKNHPHEAIRFYQDAALIIHAQQYEDIHKEHAVRYSVSLLQRFIRELVNMNFIERSDHRLQAVVLKMNDSQDLPYGLKIVKSILEKCHCSF